MTAKNVRRHNYTAIGEQEGSKRKKDDDLSNTHHTNRSKEDGRTTNINQWKANLTVAATHRKYPLQTS